MITFMCIFTIGQAIWRKIQDVGLAELYVSSSALRVFVWHMLSMAHVPLANHEYGLQVIFIRKINIFCANYYELI